MSEVQAISNKVTHETPTGRLRWVKNESGAVHLQQEVGREIIWHAMGNQFSRFEGLHWVSVPVVDITQADTAEPS